MENVLATSVPLVIMLLLFLLARVSTLQLPSKQAELMPSAVWGCVPLPALAVGVKTLHPTWGIIENHLIVSLKAEMVLKIYVQYKSTVLIKICI